MELFFRQLVRRLDAERPGWRETSVVMMDNATYHTSPALLKVLALLRVPVLFTGPHSYQASPIELFFAAFKAADINPWRVTTGQR